MEFCTGCGHRLGVGRFCTNCGQPINADALRDGGARRPDVQVPTGPPPADPPPTYATPPAPRYPMFVDDVEGVPPTAPAPPVPPAAPRGRRTGPSFLTVALTVVILLLVAAVGGLLMFSGDDDARVADATTPVGDTVEGTPSASTRVSPSPDRTEAPPPPADAEELATLATATAPVTARPNLDTEGRMVSYRAANMLDGVDETCWRMPGDGTGQELVFTFPAPSEISEVGLINGYAKRSGRLDWYAGNRRVLEVEWVFDDGTVVPQTLAEDRTMQTIAIDPVISTRVVLRLVAVSDPGDGPSARNNTAISGVSLVGAPG